MKNIFSLSLLFFVGCAGFHLQPNRAPNSENNFQSLTDSNDQTVGFELKATDAVKADLITKVRSPQFFSPLLDFAGIQKDFAQQGKRVLFIAAAAYCDRHLNIEGIAVDDGDSVGYPKLYPKHSALVEIADGQFKFYYTPDLTTEEVTQLTASAEKNHSDLFQQHFAIHDGVASDSRFGSETEETGKYEMRFLVQHQDGSFGVVQFDKKMLWSEATQQLKNYGIVNAVYMDMGGMQIGARFSPDGSGIITGGENREAQHKSVQDSHFLLGQTRMYTNLLVFYTNN